MGLIITATYLWKCLDFVSRSAYIDKMKPNEHATTQAGVEAPSAQRPLILAPLRGVTDAIYRSTYAEYFDGIDLAVAPFVTTHAGHRIKPSHVSDLRPEDNQRMPVVPQVLTKSATDLITLAKHLFDMGYGTINLNCGCPFPQVANKGRGSGLLCNPEDLDQLLDIVMAHIPNRLSIKTRLGRHSVEEIKAIIPIFNRYPLESIIIHPRTGIQMYTGRPHLEIFAWCLQNCRHPVIYNGDITNWASFTALTNRFAGVTGWMIGRGVITNPFLPGFLQSPKKVDQAKRTLHFRQFQDALFERYRSRLSGPGHLLDRMKGLWKYFAQGFIDSDAARKRIHKARTIDEYENAVASFLDGGLKWVT